MVRELLIVAGSTQTIRFVVMPAADTSARPGSAAAEGDVLWFANDVCDTLGVAGLKQRVEKMPLDCKQLVTMAESGSTVMDELWMLKSPGIFRIALQNPSHVGESFVRWSDGVDHAQTRKVPPTAAEVEELKLKQIWTAIDTDGTGSLNEDELRHVFKLMGQSISDKKLTAIFKQIDADGSLELEFEEFLEWWFSRATAEPPKPDASAKLSRGRSVVAHLST
jgi:hypothetical protein